MRIAYSPEHLAYKESLDTFVEKRLRPLLKEYDLDNELSSKETHAFWNELCENSDLADVPRHEDGSIDYVAVDILLESLAYGNATVAFFGLASVVFPAQTWESLNDQQRETYSHLFAPGMFLSGGFSEPGAGSNPSEMVTVAKRVDDGWVVTGRKLWSSGADHSDALLLQCYIDDGEGEPTLGQLLLDRSVSPYETNPIETIGLRGHGLCEIVLDGVRVPLDARIDSASADKAGLQRTLQKGRLSMAAIAVGLAQRALDVTLEYAKNRTQFGKTIAEFQLIQELLAQMYEKVTLARLAMFYACSILEDGKTAAKETSLAKSYAAEAAVQVSNMGVQVHGAMGLTKETEIEMILRDARMLPMPDGTTQIHQLIIGRELTGKSAFR